MDLTPNKIPAVPDSPEFRRIIALARRRIDLNALPQIPEFRTPQGIARGAAPRPWQIVFAHELHWNGGVFAAFPVGIGKTWCSYVAPHCTPVPARRPVLFVPAMAIEKTRIEFRELAKDWIQPQPMPMILSHSALTQRHNVRLLDEIKPDLVILDEASKFRKLDEGSRAIRIDRYMTANPSTMCVAMDGTIGRKSYKDYAHIMRWCLKDRSPLPLFDSVLWQWCQALDDDDLVGMGRWRPGVLSHFAGAMTAEETAELHANPWLSDGGMGRARAGILRHMIETPGVLIVDESSCDLPIKIDFVRCPADPTIDAAFQHFRATSETPDGFLITDNLTKYNHCDTLGQGYYDRWDPRPKDTEIGRTWLAARRTWGSFVKDQIQDTRRSRFPLDTEAAVADAHPNHIDLIEWRQVEPTFIPNPVTEWYSGSVVYRLAQWIRDEEAQGHKVLLWVRSRPMAQALMSVIDVPYYGSKGLRHDVNMRPQKDSIETARRNPDGSPCTSAILSFDANHIVRNLQRYWRVGIVGWEGATDRVEQWLGRVHRQNQTRSVHATIFLTSGETIDAFQKTLREARGVVQRNGHTQKITQAEIVRRPNDDQDLGPRWRTRKDSDV